MEKVTFYFSHDYGARNDPKMVNLQIKHGMEGVGIYWCIIEMLYEEGGKIPLDYDRITFALRSHREIIESILKNFGLFSITKNKISSTSVLRRLNLRNDKSIKARESANKRWEKYDRNANAQNNDAIKENKGKENKGNGFSKSFFSEPELTPAEVLNNMSKRY